MACTIVVPAAAQSNGCQVVANKYTPFSSQPLYMNALNEVNTNYSLLLEKIAASDDPSQYADALEQIEDHIAQYTTGANQLYKRDMLMEVNALIVALL